MIDRYWSAVHVLKKRPAPTVEHTALAGLRTKRTKRLVMLLIMLLADITPPKHIAQIISQMVSIMPRMPLVATRASISAWPVDMDVLPNIDVIRALKPVAKSRTLPSTICRRMWGWNSRMHIPAITDDIKSVMMVGSLARMRQAVMTGTSRSHGDRLNVCASVPAKARSARCRCGS